MWLPGVIGGPLTSNDHQPVFPGSRNHHLHVYCRQTRSWQRDSGGAAKIKSTKNEYIFPENTIFSESIHGNNTTEAEEGKARR